MTVATGTRLRTDDGGSALDLTGRNAKTMSHGIVKVWRFLRRRLRP
jgi:hypothetical protein